VADSDTTCRPHTHTSEGSSQCRTPHLAALDPPTSRHQPHVCASASQTRVHIIRGPWGVNYAALCPRPDGVRAALGERPRPQTRITRRRRSCPPPWHKIRPMPHAMYKRADEPARTPSACTHAHDRRCPAQLSPGSANRQRAYERSKPPTWRRQVTQESIYMRPDGGRHVAPDARSVGCGRCHVAHFFARGSFAPSARSILAMI